MANLDQDIQSTFANPYVKALINVKFTASFLDQLGSAILKPHGISEPQYNILRILRGAKTAISVNQVKERMIQKSPNSTRLMDKLCDKKLAERKRCQEDRRLVKVQITNKGLELLEAIDLSPMEAQIRNLNQAEATELNRLLDKLRA